MKQRKMYRQGDVLIMRIDDDTKVGAKVATEAGRVVLAHGEVTGHSHAIADRAATLFDLPIEHNVDTRAATLALDRIMRCRTTVKLQHEEHATITLARGTYRVRIQREYSPEALRNVAD